MKTILFASFLALGSSSLFAESCYVIESMSVHDHGIGSLFKLKDIEETIAIRQNNSQLPVMQSAFFSNKVVCGELYKLDNNYNQLGFRSITIKR